MSNEHPSITSENKPTRGAKNSQGTKASSTKRVSRGYRPKARNALYQLAGEFKRRHPKSTAADAWRHLAAVASVGAHDVLLTHDSLADVLTYRPDSGKFETRTIKRDSFDRRWRTLADA